MTTKSDSDVTRFGAKPPHYGGYWPDPEDILVMFRHRDSDTITRSNWAVAMKRLEDACREAGVEPYDETPEPTWPGQAPPATRQGALILWRARHWACGWVEYLGMKKDAPPQVLHEAEAIGRELSEYPVLDEDNWTQVQAEDAEALWADYDVRERLELLRTAFPDDCPMSLREMARSDAPPIEVWDDIGVR